MNIIEFNAEEARKLAGLNYRQELERVLQFILEIVSGEFPQYKMIVKAKGVNHYNELDEYQYWNRYEVDERYFVYLKAALRQRGFEIRPLTTLFEVRW